MLDRIKLRLVVAVITGWAGVVSALPVTSVGTNTSFADAQSIDGFFSLGFDERIQNTSLVNTSTTIPHVEISGAGDDTRPQYFSFNVAQNNSTAIFDIDCGYSEAGNFGAGCPEVNDGFDALLRLYDSAEAPLATYDDFFGGPDIGSVDEYDSLGETTLAAGLYYIEVSDSFYDDFPANATYLLNVSIGPASDMPEPGVLALFGLGLLGLGLSRRKQSP